MYKEDTIAAISTAHGTGGIGIIRLSGEQAFTVAEKLFQGKRSVPEMKTHTLHYGKIVDPDNGQTVDEVLLSKMNGPHTFTREDVVEINCHGGIVVVRTILDLVVRAGARLAEPGEFTQRAFLNGRLDLSQAEAVIDLIQAKTLESSKAAVDQLEGRLSGEIRKIRNKLISLIAHIEVTVDYPEHDIEEITGKKVYEEIIGIREQLQILLRSFDRGRVLREGVSVVIIGRPNVGKSSLLNALAGKNKAIVTDIPGTTRDIIEEYINIHGIPVRLVDTAGIRETADVVEKIGVERAEKAIQSADLLIVMLDASEGIQHEDREILERVPQKKHIVLINKMDLVPDEDATEMESALAGRSIIKTSMAEEQGVEQLENSIAGLFSAGALDLNNEVLLTNIRHKDLISQALHSIEEAMAAYDSGMPLDCITIDIKNCTENLGAITGESVSEDVTREIFSRFCIGK